MPKKCSCKKLIGGSSKPLFLINDTGDIINNAWITASNSDTWDYEVVLEKSVAQNKVLEIDMAETKINDTFDVLIYHETDKKYQAYYNFDYTKKLWVLQEYEFSRGKNRPNPERKDNLDKPMGKTQIKN